MAAILKNHESVNNLVYILFFSVDT